MGQTVLEQLLERRLIPVEDDPTLEKVQDAANEFAKKIRGAKVPATTATLVALDPEVSPTDPVGDLVMAELRKHWKSVDQKHPDRPMTLVRGILADALFQAGSDASIAAAITLTARSYWPHTSLGVEAEVWQQVLQTLGVRAEKAAVDAWEGTGAKSGIDVPPLTLSPVRAQVPKIEAEELSRHLTASVGPMTNPPQGVTPNAGQASTSGYPMTADWAAKMGAIAGPAITSNITAALRGLANSIDLSAASQSIEAYAQELTRAIASAIRPIHATALRTQVLFWREALYSPQLQLSYRRVPSPARVLALAIDLHDIVPPHSPLAIEALLEEAARTVSEDESIPLADLLGGLDAVPSELTTALGRGKPQSGRTPLLSLVRETISAGQVPEALSARLGVNPSTPVALAELSVWLFRDLQAERLLSGK